MDGFYAGLVVLAFVLVVGDFEMTDRRDGLWRNLEFVWTIILGKKFRRGYNRRRLFRKVRQN